MAHKDQGPALAFVIGGTISTAAATVLEVSAARTYVILLGVFITVLGCVIGLVAGRRTAAAHAEEVALLRLALDVERLDGEQRQARLEELEAEMSMHSRALARLLDL